MEAAQRMKLVKMIEKMNEHPAFCKKVRMRDVSVFKKNSCRRY